MTWSSLVSIRRFGIYLSVSARQLRFLLTCTPKAHTVLSRLARILFLLSRLSILVADGFTDALYFFAHLPRSDAARRKPLKVGNGLDIPAPSLYVFQELGGCLGQQGRAHRRRAAYDEGASRGRRCSANDRRTKVKHCCCCTVFVSSNSSPIIRAVCTPRRYRYATMLPQNVVRPPRPNTSYPFSARLPSPRQGVLLQHPRSHRSIEPNRIQLISLKQCRSMIAWCGRHKRWPRRRRW